MVSGGEEGPDSQQLGLGPGAVGEQRREGGQGGYDFGRQIQGIISGSMAREPPSIPVSDPLDLPVNLAKMVLLRPAKITEGEGRCPG